MSFNTCALLVQSKPVKKLRVIVTFSLVPTNPCNATADKHRKNENGNEWCICTVQAEARVSSNDHFP